MIPYARYTEEGRTERGDKKWDFLAYFWKKNAKYLYIQSKTHFTKPFKKKKQQI